MPDGEEKYIHPTAAGRLTCIILFLVLVLAGLAINPLVEYLAPPVPAEAGLEELQRNIRRLTEIGVYLCIGGFLLSLGLAGYFFHLGRQTRRSGEFPPPASVNILLVKTRVVSGQRARRMGHICYLAAGLILLTTLPWLFAIGWLNRGI